MNFSEIFIKRPVATTLLTIGNDSGRNYRVSFPAGITPAADRFSHDQRLGRPAWSGPRDHGHIGGRSPGTAVRAYCRGHRDDFDQFPGLDVHRPPVRAGPQYRWRCARRAGCDQRGAKLPAHHAAEQSNLSQSQSGGCADPHPGAYFRHCEQGADVRRSLDDTSAEALTGGRSRPGFRGRRFSARGSCGIGSRSVEQIRDRPGRCRHRTAKHQRKPAQGTVRQWVRSPGNPMQRSTA